MKNAGLHLTEKSENMVSDSESSKAFGAGNGIRNGDQCGRVLNFDEEHSDQAQTSDHSCDSGEQDCSVSVDDVEVEKTDESDAGKLQTKCDLLAECNISLQSIQELLENEIQKLEEIGRSSSSPSGSNCPDPTFTEDSAFHGQASKHHSLLYQLYCDENEEICVQPRVVQVNKLHGQVNMLKSKLEEVTSAIKSKEDQITELESILKEKGELQEASVIISEPLQEKQNEMELELESLFKQKIEFELEYLFVYETTQKLTVTIEDQVSLIKAQKSLAQQQMQMMQKLKEAEHKAEILKSHAEVLETSCEELLTTEEVLKVQNRLYVRTLYFITQILLLAIVLFLIFVMRPPSSGFVPT